MSNNQIFNVIILTAIIVIAIFFLIGAIKDARSSMRKLNAHEDRKRKNKIPSSIRPYSTTEVSSWLQREEEV